LQHSLGAARIVGQGVDDRKMMTSRWYVSAPFQLHNTLHKQIVALLSASAG
jgi:hypothetical protein